VYNRFQPLFARHGVFTYPKVVDQVRETATSKSGGRLQYATVTVEYTFAADDGSSITATVVGEGMDSSDKASNKAMAAAHKYALCQVLNIPYKIIDPDASSPAMVRTDRPPTEAQIENLKRLWGRKYADMIANLDKPARRKMFGDWVGQRCADHVVISIPTNSDINFGTEAGTIAFWRCMEEFSHAATVNQDATADR